MECHMCLAEQSMYPTPCGHRFCVMCVSSMNKEDCQFCPYCLTDLKGQVLRPCPSPAELIEDE